MTKVYFTFGSDPKFPFGRDEYVEVEAESICQACALFKAVHPNRPGSDVLNCASWYPEIEFISLREKYYPNDPVETISVKR